MDMSMVGPLSEQIDDSAALAEVVRKFHNIREAEFPTDKAQVPWSAAASHLLTSSNPQQRDRLERILDTLDDEGKVQ